MPRNKYSMAKLEGLDAAQQASVLAKARAAATEETEEGEGGEAAVVLDDRDRFEVVQMRKAVTGELGGTWQAGGRPAGVHVLVGCAAAPRVLLSPRRPAACLPPSRLQLPSTSSPPSSW